MLGMHGTYEANLAMHGCDVMLAIGARFDDRVTGRLNAFSQGSRKIHIDIDRPRINKNVPVEIAIVSDAGKALDALLAAWKASDGTEVDTPALTTWWRQIDEWRGEGEPEVHAGHDARRDHPAAIRDPAAVSRSPGPRPATSSSPPRSASTRCGPRNTSISKAATTG